MPNSLLDSLYLKDQFYMLDTNNNLVSLVEHQIDMLGNLYKEDMEVLTVEEVTPYVSYSGDTIFTNDILFIVPQDGSEPFTVYINEYGIPDSFSFTGNPFKNFGDASCILYGRSHLMGSFNKNFNIYIVGTTHDPPNIIKEKIKSVRLIE